MITTPLHEDFVHLASDPSLYEALQGQRLYLTGATGQIGWYLLHWLCYLQQEGRLNAEVTAHVRTPERLRHKFPQHADLPCRFVVGDDAARPLAEEPFDLVLHTASLASPRHFAKTPVDVMIPNGILTQALLEQIRCHQRDCRFLYVSTTGVTGHIPDEQRPSRETDFGPLSCTDLSNVYLESKRFGETLTLAYHQQYAIPVWIVRPSITYGPGFDLDDGRSYADFVRSLLQRQPIALTSDGSAIRNFLYVRDFVRGLMRVIGRAPHGCVMNIASPAPISILTLATLLNTRIYPESLGPVAHQPPADNAGLTRVNFKSTDASVAQLMALGWQPEVSPLEGFQKTLRHYQESAA